MHLASRTFMIVFLLTFSTMALAKDARDLTKIKRNTCLMFPKFIDFDKQISSVHYKADQNSYSSCSEDEYGNIEYDTCDDTVDVEFKYRYTTITTYDHYTIDGKLITTTQENTSFLISQKVLESTQGEWSYSERGDLPKDEAAKNQLKNMFNEGKQRIEVSISGILFDSAHSTCDGSFYNY